MRLLPLTLVSLAAVHHTIAGNLTKDASCSTGSNRLQEGTYQFWSECDSITFCSNAGICELKRCRKEDFPFGYTQDSPLIPDKCKTGEFCPDEGSDCQPVIPVGQPCQFNRDDQCEGPPNFVELADNSGRGLNFNGSVCLNNMCMWANATLGNNCTVENTAYVGYSNSGEFYNIVSRGNCRTGLYCDSQSLTCFKTKLLGETCDADKECDTANCLSTGVCGESAATPHHFGIYVYILVGLGIIGGMVGTLLGLFFTHRKQREVERAKRAQYWREQNAFHQNLMNMRETARASILSLPNNGGSRDYGSLSRDPSDESHTPILQGSATQKSSGLRNYIDDGSSEFDDSGMYTSNPRKAEGRF